MNKSLETINNSIKEIREILNAECAPINQLPDMVSDLSKSAAKSGYTTAFMFSTNPNPTRPVGGNFDITTGLVDGIEGWSQTVTTNANDLFMSFAIFNPEGEKNTDWSVPVNLKGKGINGTRGPQGPQGPQGIPGEKGEAGISYRTVSVYTTTDSVDIIPGQPRGGHWNMKTNELSLPVSEDGTKWWSNTDDEPTPKRFLWTSNATFQDNGNLLGDWCEPFRMTGADGKNGVDGDLIEFIYRLVPTYEDYLNLRNFHLSSDKLESKDERGFVPDKNDNLNIDTDWTPSPAGISPTMQIEVVCNRTRKGVDEVWSGWSNCTIWSKWGEDGMDGDGVEYIYLVTEPSMTSGHVRDYLVPTYSIDDDKYQQDEFCFNDEWGFKGYDWTDEPRDVGPGEPMEWVMVRKQKDGIWQSFSDPALWATYSESGVSYITSFVFARGNVDNPPVRPEGGDYFDPKPNGDIWSDTVPSDSTLPVWMSTRVFCSTSEYSDDDWSDPKMLADTPDFQVEYSAYKGEISREKIDNFEGESTEENEQKWRDLQKEKYKIEWGDDSQIKDPVWMITATRHGGIWSDWTISKIKGEKGDKGEPGSSVKIEGEFETLDQLKAAWNKYVTTGDLFDFGFHSEDGIINQGDGWYIKDEGKLYSYSGGWSVGEPDTDFNKYWFGVDIKGKPGDSAYIYIAYCNENVATATVDLIGPGKYIGISTKDLSEEDRLKWSNYTWTKWEGEDGWGYEQIFLATSKDLGFDPENNHLPIPTNNEQIPEYLPPHAYGNLAYPSDKWSDTPILNENYPFCWVVTRKANGTTFGDWKGRDGKAALYSRYSYDGVSNVFVDLSNDLAVIPMEDGKVDPDFINLDKPVETIVKVYVGDEEVESSGFSVTGNNVTVNGAKVTLNLNTLTPDIKTIPLIVELDNKPYTVNWNILQTDVAYELTPKTYSIRRYVTGDKVGYLELDELRVDIWKWSGSKWIATNIPLFAYVVYTNGSDEIFSTEDRITVANNGVATINLRNLLNVASIKIYVVAQNNEGNYVSNGEILSFENITIVADGAPGQNGEDGKDGKDGLDGKDGPGREYIFCVTAPISTGVDANILYSELLEYYTEDKEDVYQQDDFYPKKYYENSDWTDEPRGVNEQQPLEWVSTRKKIDGVWGKFSKPIVWNTYVTDGKDAYSYKTSYVFTRSINPPDMPIRGTFETGKPENTDVWSDTVPMAGEGEVWMSHRMFRSDDTTIDNWSEPVKMTDTADFEVIYGIEGASHKLYDLPTQEYVKSKEGVIDHNGWFDEAEIGVEFHYMATSVFNGGKWSDWVISKIKGEKGEKGEDGKSVSIRKRLDSIDDLKQSWELYKAGQTDESKFIYPLQLGDGYLVGSDLWVWDGNYESFDDAWHNVGQIQGPAGEDGKPGDSVYFYIGYMNSLDDEEVITDGRGGKYINTIITNNPIDPEDLKKPDTYSSDWKLWHGDDGWGWEQVFKATSDYNPPHIAISNKNISESDLINKYDWSDKPISVNSTDHQYIWYMFRKSTGEWKGEYETDQYIYAALYDRYAKDGEQGPQGEPGQDGEDGRGIVDIEKLFAVNNDPINHPDPDGAWYSAGEVSTSPTNRYMWCKETPIYTDGRGTSIYYIAAIEGEPGATGTGNDAPIIYPAGIWSKDKTYSATSDKCPYVFYADDQKYYMVKTNMSVPKGTVPTNIEYWEPIDSFEAIYADIGLFNQALVGKWVFHGDYMFSQEGVLGYYNDYILYIPAYSILSGQECNYTQAMSASLQGYNISNYNTLLTNMSLHEKIENGVWIPNTCFNAKTGEVWFAGRKVRLNADGSGSLGGHIEWNINGNMTIDGAILNPITTSDNVLNKTLNVSNNVWESISINVGNYDETKLSTSSIKKIGTATIISTNSESPSHIKLNNCIMTMSNIIGSKDGSITSLSKDFDEFVLAPGSVAVFDVYDNKNKQKRCLIPQTVFGWFNLNGEIIPYNCLSNTTYEQLSEIVTYSNTMPNSLSNGQFVSVITLPDKLTEYMSVCNIVSLHSDHGSGIYFGKLIDDNNTQMSTYTSKSLTQSTFIDPRRLTFREGGTFGFVNSLIMPITPIKASSVIIKLFDSTSMIGYFSFGL